MQETFAWSYGLFYKKSPVGNGRILYIYPIKPFPKIWYIMRRFSITIIGILIGLISSLALMAQPTGGPYGPTQRNYELPKVTGKIYYVSPDGKAQSAGNTADTPTTIESAVEKAVSGDAIVMRGGTYRSGDLTFNQAITIQPYRDEHPVS
jgi:hypothetical protein